MDKLILKRKTIQHTKHSTKTTSNTKYKYHPLCLKIKNNQKQHTSTSYTKYGYQTSKVKPNSNMQTANTKHIKIVFLGAPGTGKSTNIHQFLHGNTNVLDNVHQEDTYRTSYEMDGIMYWIDVLDTIEPEEYTEMRHSFVYQCDCIAVFYSIVSMDSFKMVGRYLERIAHDKGRGDFDAIMLVGNKVDLEGREVSFEAGLSFAREKGLQFMEVSSMNNVDALFNNLIQLANVKDENKQVVKKRGVCILM